MKAMHGSEQTEAFEESHHRKVTRPSKAGPCDCERACKGLLEQAATCARCWGAVRYVAG